MLGQCAISGWGNADVCDGFRSGAASHGHARALVEPARRGHVCCQPGRSSGEMWEGWEGGCGLRSQ
eukprot:3830668-Rhodomonas_salina.3